MLDLAHIGERIRECRKKKMMTIRVLGEYTGLSAGYLSMLEQNKTSPNVDSLARICEAPAAVRYPRGSAFDGFREYRAPIEYGKSEPVYEEEDIAIISVGHMFEQAVQVRKRLKEIGYNCTLINARFVKPVDEEMLRKLTVEHRLIVTLEENIRRGGFGEFVTAYLAGLETDAEVLNLALPDDYIEHGSVDLLRSEVMLDIESCVARIITAYIAEEKKTA